MTANSTAAVPRRSVPARLVVPHSSFRIRMV
jgi:hypothetical protein